MALRREEVAKEGEQSFTGSNTEKQEKPKRATTSIHKPTDKRAAIAKSSNKDTGRGLDTATKPRARTTYRIGKALRKSKLQHDEERTEVPGKEEEAAANSDEEWGSGAGSDEDASHEEDLGETELEDEIEENQREEDGGIIRDMAEMGVDEHDIAGLTDSFNNEGEYVPGIGQEPTEDSYLADLRAKSRRARALKAHTQMCNRVIWDNIDDKNLKDDELDDVLPDDPGGNYELVGDPRGSIVHVGKGVYRDFRTRNVYKSNAPRQGRGGKSVTFVASANARERLKAKVVGSRAGAKGRSIQEDTEMDIPESKPHGEDRDENADEEEEKSGRRGCE